MYAQDVGGMGTSPGRNFKECPIEEERNYTLYNFTSDSSKFPPLIPNGRYKVNMQTTCGSVELWSMYAMFEIIRPIV
ncbi:hypothetical protein ILUMI_11843 [Ignelater luminosus]|uniref:Uncharacterized protein n=1 Tax=Ignelater luminosus TaxID=2038154 RepID=A0A8K0GDJ2_IGNLU|nr:hypothetical protein ILUMI_11843 [Ignelater luminosus]